MFSNVKLVETRRRRERLWSFEVFPIVEWVAPGGLHRRGYQWTSTNGEGSWVKNAVDAISSLHRSMCYRQLGLLTLSLSLSIAYLHLLHLRYHNIMIVFSCLREILITNSLTLPKINRPLDSSRIIPNQSRANGAANDSDRESYSTNRYTNS